MSSPGLIEIIGVCILSLALFALILRWAMRINTMVKYQQIQIKLLAKIAQRQGVTKDEIEAVINEPGDTISVR